MDFRDKASEKGRITYRGTLETVRAAWVVTVDI
jgi:hypothetical protein